jgi:hypothetical protein
VSLPSSLPLFVFFNFPPFHNLSPPCVLPEQYDRR